jgi:Tol biopolymer transport system component
LGGIGILLLGATLLLTSIHAAASATCPGRNGKVAVTSHPGEQNAIGIFKPNRRLHVLYKGVRENSIFNLSFSCDGKKIAFTEAGGTPSRALRVLNLSTGEAPFVPTQRLTGGAPAFLRNGRILFSGGRVDPNRMGGTFTVRPDGTGLRRLFGREQLAASSDGRWFVATDRGGHLRVLYLLNAKGRRVGALTPPAPAGTEYLNPSFSPNGRLIAYEERRFGLPSHDTLYVVRRDGTHRRRLTFGPESASEPAFSPDGRWLAFTRTKSEGPAGNVFAMLLEDPSKVRKFGLSYGYQYPAWGPR